MKIAIIQFPGSNCERESVHAVKRAGMEPVEFLWNEPVEKLRKCDGYFIIGGFSYEDRSRAGIIASLDPVMNTIRQEGEKGKPLLGICNGAQVLVETGLVPGLKDNRVGLALASNQRMKDGHVLGTGYYNTWVNVQLTAPSDRCAFTRHLKRGEWMTIPIAHAEGRFMMRDNLLKELQSNNLTVFRYCDDEGNLSPEFPTNPNGSMDNLAAVCNTNGNIMAMMPHPERTPGGDAIFSSMRDTIQENTKIQTSSLLYNPLEITLSRYSLPKNSFELLIDLIITDNEAVSVESTLRHLGFPVTVKRQTHWEVTLEPEANGPLKEDIIASGELFNSNKETLFPGFVDTGAVSILVRYKDDMVGRHKREVLKDWFHLDGIRNIKKGVAWTIVPEKNNQDNLLQEVLDTHILFNPYSHEGYQYIINHE